MVSIKSQNKNKALVRSNAGKGFKTYDLYSAGAFQGSRRCMCPTESNPSVQRGTRSSNGTGPQPFSAAVSLDQGQTLGG